MGKFENAANTGHLGYVVQKTQSGKSPDYRDAIIFEKRFFLYVFTIPKRIFRVFKFLRFEERFSKSSVFVTDECGR